MQARGVANRGFDRLVARQPVWGLALLRLYFMSIKGPQAHERWSAKLHLRFAHRETGTVLMERHHSGPLTVQKALYPEGRQVCHAVIVHPPGGVAGGDDLNLEIELEANSRAVVTTPAAGKWYKAPGRPCRQQVTIRLAQGSSLDWLPQENIFFNATRVESAFRLQIDPGATAMGWEIAVLGRQASGEQWTGGSLDCTTSVQRTDGLPLWFERLAFGACDAVRKAPQGLFGYNVFGTLWAIGSGCTAAHTEELAAALPFKTGLRAGATCLPDGVLLIRALADSVEPLRQLMIDCWLRLRPQIHGLPPQRLRLWAT
jgi:urease accessory protein